jgi:hypothetical protein
LLSRLNIRGKIQDAIYLALDKEKQMATNKQPQQVDAKAF